MDFLPRDKACHPPSRRPHASLPALATCTGLALAPLGANYGQSGGARVLPGGHRGLRLMAPDELAPRSLLVMPHSATAHFAAGGPAEESLEKGRDPVRKELEQFHRL